MDWQTWGAAADTIKGAGKGKKIVLSFPFVLANSESIYVDDAILPREKYTIDYQRGIVRIHEKVANDSVIRITYTRLPFFLQSIYSLREIAYSDAREPQEAGPVSLRPAQAAEKPETGRLVFGGMKSISFSVGSNRGVSLDQTLKATVTGKITPSIQVKAILSDENLPVQPEGNTEELEYLDKVFVEISGNQARAVLGDFTLSNNYSTFSPLKREVMGVSGEAELKSTKVMLAGSSSKGVFRTNSFRGTEGLQGPYELLSQGRVTGEVILAGSEKVYLDGALLKRGQNRDYTVDYDRGTLTFTPRQLITADSEIAVDIEVTQEDFDRTAVFAGVERSELPAGLKFQALYAREKDDPGRTRTVSLDDEERKIIADAGDDAGAALGSGITQVAPGEGDYIIVPEDTVSGVPGHFEFSDSTGDYLLLLIEAGTNRGDYLLDGVSKQGKPIYRYAGVGQGNYIIGKRLPLPMSQELITARLRREGERNFTFDMEYNLSVHDQNILSPHGDGDNAGDAAALRTTLKGLRLGAGVLGVSANLSTINDRFKSFDRARPWYFYRDWNLEKEALQGREILGLFSTFFTTENSFEGNYTFGNLGREDFSGTRHEAKFKYTRSADRALRSRFFSTSMNGSRQRRTRLHQTHAASYGFWVVVPSLLFSEEEFLKDAEASPDSGLAYRLLQVGLSSRERSGLAWRVSLENRDTRELADTTGGWIDSRRNRTFSLSLSSRSSPLAKGEVQFIHRIDDNFMLGDRRTADLARLKAVVRLPSFGFRTDIDYEISQNQTRTLQKNVVFVGEGKGDYNLLGEPVGKGRGDYMLVFLATTDLIPTHKVDFTWRVNVGKGFKAPRAPGGGVLSWLKANVSLDQTLSVREVTTFDKPWKVYLLFPSALQRDESTLSGITSLRQDWSLLGAYRNVSLILRYQRSDEEDNLFQGVSEERFFSQHALKFDKSLSEVFTATIEAKRELKRRKGKGLPAGSGGEYDVEGWSFSGGGGVRLSAGSTIDAAIELATRKDEISAFKERLLVIKPSFVLRVLKSATLYGRYELARSFEEAGVGARPVFFTGGGNRHRWSLTSNLRLSRVISLVATYHGRSEKSYLGNRIVEHNLKVETRAYF